MSNPIRCMLLVIAANLCACASGASGSHEALPIAERLEKADALDRALSLAETHPGAVARARAVRLAREYFAFTFFYFGSGDGPRAARLQPILRAVLSSTDPCDSKRNALSMLAPEASFAALQTPELEACLLPLVGYVVRLYKDRNRCEDGVQVAARVWPSAHTDEDRIAIFDAVDSCSTAFNRRTHFAFAPPEVVLDYERLRAERSVQELWAAAWSAQSDASEQCRSSCLTLYAENGVCNNACSGDSRCLANCASLGAQCDRSCE